VSQWIARLNRKVAPGPADAIARPRRARQRMHEWRPVMSFLSALFGRRADAKAGWAAEPVEYKGFIIRAAPYKNNGHYQTAGTIEREIGGVRKEHRFIRADSYAAYEDAVTFTVNKARQIIDLQGDKIFDQASAPSQNR
jgi:hypothetical protein